MKYNIRTVKEYRYLRQFGQSKYFWNYGDCTEHRVENLDILDISIDKEWEKWCGFNNKLYTDISAHDLIELGLYNET